MSPDAPSPSNTPGGRPKGGAWVMRDRPGLLWMVAAVITAVVHPFVPGSTWLMVHMIALGALTHSIMVWSTHFTVSLLKNHPDIDVRATQNRRLVVLHLGIIGVLIGVPTMWWWLTLTGATAVVVAVVWHGWQLVRRLRDALPGRFRIVVHHYLASAAFLPVGATLGVLLTRGWSDEMRARMALAHSLVNVLGWVGITVAGTLVTLWPTILRVRMDPAAEQRAKQALPGLVAGLSVAVIGALAGWRWVLLAGVLGYLVALLWTGRSLIAPARAKPPMHFASWSVAAGAGWFLVGIAMIAWRVATAPDMAAMTHGYDRVATVLIAGFGLQVLCGALSHMVPAVIGGGPKVVRVGIEAFDRLGMTRIVIINVPLVLALLPLPSGTRVALTTLVLIGLASFIPIMLIGIKRVMAARREAARSTPDPRRDLALGRAEAARVLDPPFPRMQLMAGITLVALALAAGPALQPVLDGGSGAVAASTTSVEPTGETTTVEVAAQEDMGYSPSSVEVPAGDRLVIELTNEDGSTVHDLYFDDEHQTPRLTKGESATLDLGVVGADREGWCAVTGHKAMGVIFDVEVAPFALDPSKKWPKDYQAHDATLPPLTDETTPVLHGRLGDTFVITLVNDGSIGHSIDFHAGALAPDRLMRTIAPPVKS